MERISFIVPESPSWNTSSDATPDARHHIVRGHLEALGGSTRQRDIQKQKPGPHAHRLDDDRLGSEMLGAAVGIDVDARHHGVAGTKGGRDVRH